MGVIEKGELLTHCNYIGYAVAFGCAAANGMFVSIVDQLTSYGDYYRQEAPYNNVAVPAQLIGDSLPRYEVGGKVHGSLHGMPQASVR